MWEGRIKNFSSIRRGLARVTAQFQHFAADAERNASREQGPERRLVARLERLHRADARLLDAYHAKVITLEGLTDRRRRILAVVRSV